MTISEGTIQKAIQKFNDQRIGSLIYLSLTGSCLHGTECPTSDVDVKGIFVPTVDSLILHEGLTHYSDSFLQNGKLHEFKLLSVQEFVSKITKMECNAVELLFSMYAGKVIVSGPISKFLGEQSKKLLSKNVNSFIGMAKAELSRYENKKQRNCHKDIAHGIRSGQQALEFLDTGKLVYPLPGVKLIKKVKNKEVSLEDAHHLLMLQMDILNNPGEECSEEKLQLKRRIIKDVYGFISGTI